MLMIDSPAAEFRPTPRCTVCFEGNTSWSAFYGAIPLGRFASVSAAWDAIDRHLAASRAALAPAVADVPDADADEAEEASRDDGGEPDRRHRHARQRGRSPEAREHRTAALARARRPGARTTGAIDDHLPAPSDRRGRRRRHPPARRPPSWADHRPPSGQVVGFQAGSISPLAQSAEYPDAAPARVLRRPWPRQSGRSSARPRSTALIVRRAAENPRVDQERLPRILGKCLRGPQARNEAATLV